MKKVVLLGDSIRQIGYGQKVAELLQGECEVWQPADNCRFAKYTLRLLFDFKEEIKGSDVIHWNNGLWDICDLFGDGAFTSLDEYVNNMVRIAKLLKGLGKTVIFATTTPTKSGHPHGDRARIIRYNEKVVEELKKEGIIINDLFTLMDAHRDDGIREDDKIHLSEKGIELCAEQVVNIIRGNLRK